MTKGNRYLVTLEVTEPWIDRTIPTSPAGFETSRMHWYARPFVLMRRSLSGRWFQPMLKIVPASGRGGHIEVLDMRCDCGRGPVYSAEFEAARSGEVALFVNDVMPFVFKDLLPATGKWSELRDLYANNKGEAKVTITEIPRDRRNSAGEMEPGDVITTGTPPRSAQTPRKHTGIAPRPLCAPGPLACSPAALPGLLHHPNVSG